MLRKVLLTGLAACLIVSAPARGRGQTNTPSAAYVCARAAGEASPENHYDDTLTKPLSGVLPGATVEKGALTGYVKRVKGRVAVPSARSAREAASRFLERFRRLFAPARASEEFRQTEQIKTPVGDRFTFTRFIGGLPVFEDQITILVDETRAVTLVNSELQPLRRVSTVNAGKSLGGAAAEVAAVNCVATREGVKDLKATPVSEKGYFVNKDGRAVMVWRVRFDTHQPLASWEVLVEAASGRVLSVSNIGLYEK